MKTYQLTISTPDGSYFSGLVQYLTLRGADGDLMVMAGHIPFITSVQPCDCQVCMEDDTVRTGRLEGGLLTVTNESVTLLTASFAWA